MGSNTKEMDITNWLEPKNKSWDFSQKFVGVYRRYYCEISFIPLGIELGMFVPLTRIQVSAVNRTQNANELYDFKLANEFLTRKIELQENASVSRTKRSFERIILEFNDLSLKLLDLPNSNLMFSDRILIYNISRFELDVPILQYSIDTMIDLLKIIENLSLPKLESKDL